MRFKAFLCSIGIHYWHEHKTWTGRYYHACSWCGDIAEGV